MGGQEPTGPAISTTKDLFGWSQWPFSHGENENGPFDCPRDKDFLHRTNFQTAKKLAQEKRSNQAFFKARLGRP
jgi:hypothetical protein